MRIEKPQNISQFRAIMDDVMAQPAKRAILKPVLLGLYCVAALAVIYLAAWISA